MKLNELFLGEAAIWPKTKEEIFKRLENSDYIDVREISVRDDLLVNAWSVNIHSIAVGVSSGKAGYSVHGKVRGEPKRLYQYSGKYLPARFQNVESSFTINGAQNLVSLEGIAKNVGNLKIVYAHNLTKLDHLPEHIEDNVSITNCKRLTELGKFPERINGDLEIYRCPALQSLKGLPSHVEGNVDIRSVPAIQKNGGTFEGLPSYIGGDLMMEDDNITSLVGLHEHVKHVGGDIMFTSELLQRGGLGLLLIDGIKTENQFLPYGGGSGNPRADQALKIIAKYLNRRDEIFECQTELIEAGLEEFAEI